MDRLRGDDIMRFNPRQVFILPFMVGLALTVQAQQPESQIAGRVVRADNGAPIEGANVFLAPSGDINEKWPTVRTDSNGEYSFHDVADGNYIIAAVADGFLAGDYGLDQNAP